MAEMKATTLVDGNGSSMRKAGHSDDFAARVVGRPKMPSITIGMDLTHGYPGDEAQSKSGVLTTNYPIEHDKGSGMCNTGFAHDVPHALPPPTAGRPKMPGSTVDMNQEGSYVGEEMQSNTVEYPGRRGVMAPTGLCEPCRFADNCWRPLCPFTHTGNGRSKKWAAIWNLLAELEDDPHVERTSGDGDDFINATTVAAEPFDIDGVSETVWDQSSGHEIGRHGVTEVDPPGQGGCAACETDGNGNETNFALGLTQDGPPGILSHDEMEVDSTLGGSLGNRSYNVTKANVTQNALPGDHSHTRRFRTRFTTHRLEITRTARQM